MKKKIGEFTLNEIKKIKKDCDNNVGCVKCPFKDLKSCYLDCDMDLDKEIEVEEDEQNKKVL